MRALQLDPGNHRELLLRLFFAAPLERPNCGAMSKRSAESNKPVSSTTKTRASGWTMPRPQSTTTDLEAGPGVRRFAQRVPSDSHTLPFFSMEAANNVKMLLYKSRA